MKIKLLIGGSPCTHWSIAQKNNRETEASGEGWELFKNYLIAKEKWQPDYFLYENNKSASQQIKDQIAEELGVGTDVNARFTYINSALVSAQNRQRFYVTNFGDITQPEDRGILLKDILETTVNEQCYELSEDYYKGGFKTNLIGQVENNGTYKNGSSNQPSQQYRVYSSEEKGIGSESQAHRVYSQDGKSVTINAGGGGQGGKTGLYAVNIKDDRSYLSEEMIGYVIETGTKDFYVKPKLLEDKAMPLTTVHDKRAGTTNYIPTNLNEIDCEIVNEPVKDAKPIYEVRNGFITIKNKQYPIKLADGYYIIRKLTVNECKRLQTVPEWYDMTCISNSQSYKCLGNGWTVEVIKHLLSHIPNLQEHEIEVLSMYDGMACGMIALKELGCKVVKYRAYEIDKYAIQVTQHNFPEIIQKGDAFAVRNENWNED